MTREEKLKKVKELDDDFLLDCLIHFPFNPLDEDTCESYNIIKAEVLRRMRWEG